MGDAEKEIYGNLNPGGIDYKIKVLQMQEMDIEAKG